MKESCNGAYHLRFRYPASMHRQTCGCTGTSLDVPNRGTTQYMTESHIRSSWVERPERADRAGYIGGHVFTIPLCKY
jgi:hypothetical protein